MSEPRTTIIARDASELEEALIHVSVALLRNPHIALRLAVDHRVAVEAGPHIPAPPGYDPMFYQGWCMGLNAGVMAAVEGWLSLKVVKTYED